MYFRNHLPNSICKFGILVLNKICKKKYNTINSLYKIIYLQIAGLERTWNLRQKRMTNDEECRALMPGPGKVYNIYLCYIQFQLLKNSSNFLTLK